MTETLCNVGLMELGKRTVSFYKEEIFHQTTNHPKMACSLLMIPADFSVINNYLPDQFDYLKPLVSEALQQCIHAKVNTLIVPNITLHEAIEQVDLTLFSSIEIIHPVTETIRCLQAKKIKTITLIASKYSVLSSRLEQYFSQSNILVIRPNNEDIEQIDEIRKRTYLGQETEHDKKNYNALIKHYQQIAPAVIACTELSILLDEEAICSVFDMARIQIQAAIVYPH
ncbi:aspartate/glutamate racemase family protein [Colwellia sp. RE-S-Sl-9]